VECSSWHRVILGFRVRAVVLSIRVFPRAAALEIVFPLPHIALRDRCRQPTGLRGGIVHPHLMEYCYQAAARPLAR